MKENITVTAREQNKPDFRIVPVDDEMPGEVADYLPPLVDGIMDEYEDVFEALAKNGNGKTQKNASTKRQQS